MKNLFEIKFDEPMRITVINDDGIVFTSQNLNLEISHNHDRECCEMVYADWSVLDLYKIDEEYNRLCIVGIEGIGFMLILIFNNFRQEKKVLIPCYNYKNGWYSDKLDLYVKSGDRSVKIDITDFKEDN